MRSIFNAIKSRFDDLGNDIAQGITISDWKRVARGIGIILALIAATVALCLLILMGLWKFLHSFWGEKLLAAIGVVLFLCLLYASYKENRKDRQKKMEQFDEDLRLEVWAEDVYEYVRDAIFLVLRAVSEHTAIVMPTSPGTVELPNSISVKDGYVVFNFFAKVRDSVDASRIKGELNRTLYQMLRAHELQGLPSDLVEINGAHYCPLQVLDVLDFGDSITISVVFANEKTIELANARRLLYIDQAKLKQSRRKDTPYDEQL